MKSLLALLPLGLSALAVPASRGEGPAPREASGAMGASGAMPAREEPSAPDGRRGLGESSTLSDLLALFRNPAPEDEVFLAELSGLEQELAVLLATVEATYRVRGWFEVVDPRREDALAALHERFRVFRNDLEAELTGGGRDVRALAEMHLDARFRARAAAIAGVERDVREVRRGLRLLSAPTDGWVRLSEEEAQDVAGRVDLAAALLRARAKDLRALREAPGAPSEVDAGDLDELLALAALEPGAERSALFARAAAEGAARERAASEMLFTTRLRAQVSQDLEERAAGERIARERADQAALWLPGDGQERDLPRDIRRASKTDRRQRALALVREGLDGDPFDDGLAWTAAGLARILSGDLEALSYYDRFLALRGRRAHDERTWPPEGLDEREDEAVYYIQLIERELGTLPSVGGSDD